MHLERTAQTIVLTKKSLKTLRGMISHTPHGAWKSDGGIQEANGGGGSRSGSTFRHCRPSSDEMILVIACSAKDSNQCFSMSSNFWRLPRSVVSVLFFSRRVRQLVCICRYTCTCVTAAWIRFVCYLVYYIYSHNPDFDILLFGKMSLLCVMLTVVGDIRWHMLYVFMMFVI